MGKLNATVTLTGKTGQKYQFDVYSVDTTWKDNVECVYYISRRYKNNEGGFSHDDIYIGETDDLKDRINNHHKRDCFRREKYNAISIHLENHEHDRLNIESDLLGAKNPPCND